MAGMWRSAGGTLLPSVSQFRSYSDEGLDGRVPPSSSAADPLSRKFARAVPTTQTFGADRPIYDRNAYPLRKCELRVIRPVTKVGGTALNEEDGPLRNCIRASRNVAQESCPEPPRQGFRRGKEVPIGSASGGGNKQLQSARTTSEAIAILQDRQQQGLSIDSYHIVEILKRCSMQKDLIATRKVHDYIIQSGMQKHRYVATALLNVYIKCGRLQDAHRVFDGLKRTDRNVITYTVMIGAYARSGCGAEADRLYVQMKREGFVPDAFTFVSILNSSKSARRLEWVKEVHSDARKAGLESNLRVASALVHTYAKSGSIDDAGGVFDRMEKRDVITWTIMIGAYAERGCGAEAYRLFVQMKREGFIPNGFTYASILNASGSAGALEWVKEVHRDALKAGLESDLRVANALVHAYGKNGRIDDARVVFDRMEKRDVITWTIMIGACAESGCGAEAYRRFVQMKLEGFIPNAFTYASILTASASAGAWELVKEVHSDALKAGLESDLRVASSLVHMYAKSGSIDEARAVFDRMEKRDVMTWTIMIGAYAESGCGAEAYQLFLQMKREGVKPDAITYMSILNASASAGALEWVKDVHSHARKAGLESDLRVANALVHMYAKSGSIDDARVVFDRLEKRDVMTWNIMIGAYTESGGGAEAYRLFVQMKREGFTPDAFTYTNILNAPGSAGALEWVKEVHSHACKAGLESDLRVANALVRMYAKSGSIDDARVVFNGMEKRDVFTWNIMIGGLAEHGCGHDALALFRKMKVNYAKPNETTFVAVLLACSHAGLVDDGRRLFSAMTEDYGVEPNVIHYGCMVDLLGRAGHLEEAKLLIDNMPVEPDAVTWRALLGACRTYSNVQLGELAAKEVLKLEPKEAAAYVLLSNIYAAAGKWEKVSSVRIMMQNRGVRKEPGRSWIEVDNKIHGFVVGDASHPEAKAIDNELKKLSEQLKANGYIPDTKLVLHNIDEEEKELALCSHSERLAIGYGLLRVPRGKPIRVEKNLRVCSDCHEATKLISGVTGREIVVRDANRFHHFKDGVCSCGDYW